MLVIIFISFTGCAKKQSQTDYGREEFEVDMEAMGYSFETEKVDKDFLAGDRYLMEIGEDYPLNIYVYKSDKKMEKDAGNISSDGCGYDNGWKCMNISWVDAVHFYKKGSIIVQYTGTEETVMGDLETILGEQFAGME